MKIEYRLPAKNVQYGYVNVEGTEDELAELDPYALGMNYVAAVRRFWEGEADQVDHEISTDQAKALDEHTVLSQEIESTPEIKVNTYEADAEDLIVKELGATKISEEVYDEPVNEAPKPWAAPSAFDFDN